MRIDRKAKWWALLCLALFVAALVTYIPYARKTPGGPSGGSWPGLIYGFAGSAMMLLVLALALRKRWRYLKFLRVFHWTQAHVWFGLLSYPIILFHAGFSLGGPLTYTLMVLFTLVYLTGIFGLVLQQILPPYLMREIPEETLNREIPEVIEQIREEAESIAAPIRTERETALAEASESAGTLVVTVKSATAMDPFESFYADKVVPFLATKFLKNSPLARDSSSEVQFSNWRAQLAPELHNAVDRLQQLVKERRQLERQRKINWWLHSWLYVHIPLSYLLMALATVHAVMAFRYTSPSP